MFDTTIGTPIPLAEAAKYVPPARQGKKTHLSTLLRWILTGVRTRSGEIVRLEALRLGNRWMTSREAIQRFAERLTPRIEGASTPIPPRTTGQRQRAAERAGHALGKIGI
jgi:hypothetical protein